MVYTAGCGSWIPFYREEAAILMSPEHTTSVGLQKSNLPSGTELLHFYLIWALVHFQFFIQ